MNRNHAIVNAHVVPVVGEPFDGTVVITDGRIAALGPDVAAPQDHDVLDARGSWVLPGFVESHGHIGAEEEGHGWAGADINEAAEAVGPRFRAIDAIHPRDAGFDDALRGGVTSAVNKPGSGNLIGGQTVAMKCWGRIIDEMVIKDPCSMKQALGENPKNFHGVKRGGELPSTRLAIASMIREAYVAAENYRAQRDQAAADGKPFDRNLQHEALLPVLDGEIPVSQHVHRVDDIATAIRLADEIGYRLVINHATEAHPLATVLARRQIPCLVGPTITARVKQELDGRTLRTPAVLAEAGVKIALITDHPVVPVTHLVLQATLAVREGLDRDEAIRAITINPAEIMGIDDRVGSLEVGKDADVVVWSGDPLDALNRPLTVFVDGRRVADFNDETYEHDIVDPFVALADEDRENQQ